MSNDNRSDKTTSGKPGQGSDTEDSLQKELEKESAEGKESIGDAASNRNLSGSSTWDTLPDEQSDAGGSDSMNSGKKSQ